MPRKTKKYVVIGEHPRFRDSFYYLNKDTKDHTDMWTTFRPYRLAEDAGEPTAPKVFEDRSEAVFFKNNCNGLERENSYSSYDRTKWKVLAFDIFERNYLRKDSNSIENLKPKMNVEGV